MMPTANPQPDLPDADELVAYLDGELPPDECRRVEDRLASDADYRRQLEELDRAWEALDELPRSTIGDDFVRTTMDMVTLAAESDIAAQTAALPALRRKRTFLIVVACMVAATAGFAAARVLVPDSNDALLADLPAIAQVDLLTQVDNVDFLRRLGEVPLGLSDKDAQSLDQEANDLNMVDAPSRDQRQQWVEQLPADQKASLVAKWKRFQSLAPTPEAQQKLRDLEQQIAQADDADQLWHTLLAYGQWLSRRTPGEQAELRSLPTDERLRRVRQFTHQDDRHAEQQLSAEDAKALREAVLTVAEQRKQALVQQMRERGDDDPERRLQKRPAAAALYVLFRELKNDQTRDALREQLTAQLSSAAQQYLESLRTPRREAQLWQWVRDSLRPKLGPEELERFFAEDLDNNQRERLLSLPRDEMEAELEQLYFGAGAELGLRGMAGLRGFGPDPFGPGARRPGLPGDGPPRGPGRRQWDGEGRPHDPGRRGPPPDDFGPRRFDRGPEGPDDFWDDRGPPDHGPPPDEQMLPEDGPPPR